MSASVEKSAASKWIRFFIGLGLIAAFICFLMSEPVPPGVAGDVIQRNLDQDVQTTALFYMELDRMPAIEEYCVERTKKGEGVFPKL